jgi:MraZ protein
VSPSDRFLSHYVNRVDAKGRVSIPAAFRSVLAKDGFDGLYIHPGLDMEALDCGGNALLREIDGLLAMFSPFSAEHGAYSTALLSTSEILKIDPEGRISLSETLKAYAGITTEVTFVGKGHKFQIWEPSRFRTHLDEARDQLRTLQRQLSDRHAAQASPSAAILGARG